MRVTFRPTIPADFIALNGAMPPWRSRCITAELDGRVIGLGGLVHRPDGVWASAVIGVEARRYPAAIHRAGRQVMAMARALGLRQVYAAAQPDNPAAQRWLARLGFRPIAGGAFVCEVAGSDRREGSRA
jgi:RimJ/RimL family protein N-acetyltransferase